MSSRVFLVAAMLGAFTACKTEQHDLEDMLVVRFAADACETARLMKMASEDTFDSGRLVYRTYQVDGDCVSSLRKGMKDIGFRRTSWDTFKYDKEDGISERLAIAPVKGENDFEIRWEELYP